MNCRWWGYRVAVYGTRSSRPWALDNPLPANYSPVDSYPIPLSYLTLYIVKARGLCFGPPDGQAVDAQGRLTYTYGNTLTVLATHADSRIELQVIAHH